MCPSVISHLAKEAIFTVDKMLRSLPRDSLVLKHIMNIASVTDLRTTAAVEGGIIIPNETVSFINGHTTSQPPLGSGVYVFTEHNSANNGIKCSQAIGSALRFDIRLGEHLESFSGNSKLTPLHKYAKTINGGVDSFSFGPIYFVPNYLLSFYATHPGYVLSQGEYDVLKFLIFFGALLRRNYSHYSRRKL